MKCKVCGSEVPEPQEVGLMIGGVQYRYASACTVCGRVYQGEWAVLKCDPGLPTKAVFFINGQIVLKDPPFSEVEASGDPDSEDCVLLARCARSCRC